MLSSPDAVITTSALSLLESRSRREWKQTLQALKLIGVGWPDLQAMQASEAWKWLGWDAAGYREWQRAMDVAHAQLTGDFAERVRVVTELDEDAPAWFRHLQAVPWLFYRGDLSILNRKTIGFSGQRDANDEALAIAANLASEAARLESTVVSGGARGIDLAAHSAAVNAGGTTVFVLPQGLNTWNPPVAFENPAIMPKVLAVSEDVAWEDWNTDSAMRRNRMIVDLANIFTVPQSGTSGGSHSTAMYALRHDRVTYVPDLGQGFPGNHRLLLRGATPLVKSGNRYDLEQMLADSAPREKPSQASLF